MSQRVHTIKRSQKESLFLREISNLYLQLTQDQPQLIDLFINRVQLSDDKSKIHIFFYSINGLKRFEELRPTLVLYKPSMRKALAQAINARYTPDLVFRYDAQFEKQSQIEQALDKAKAEDESL